MVVHYALVALSTLGFAMLLVSCDEKQTERSGTGRSTSSVVDSNSPTTASTLPAANETNIVPPATPPTIRRFKVEDFSNMKDGELLEALKRGDLAKCQNLTDIQSPEVINLLRRGYTIGRKEGIFWNEAILLLANSGQLQLAKEFWTDFGNVPSIEMSSDEELGWGKAHELVRKPKYVLAVAVMNMGDSETTAQLWQQFPNMSLDDQIVIARAADYAPGLVYVQPALNATQFAKNRSVSNQLINSANRLVARALDEPAMRDEALRFAKQLKKQNVAHEFLIEKLR